MKMKSDDDACCCWNNEGGEVEVQVIAVAELPALDVDRRRFHKSHLSEYVPDVADGALEITKEDVVVRTSCCLDIYEEEDTDQLYANSVDTTTTVLAGWQRPALDDDTYPRSVDTTSSLLPVVPPPPP